MEVDEDVKCDVVKEEETATKDVNVSLEIVKSILNEVVDDVTRPTQEQFFESIILGMVSVKAVTCSKALGDYYMYYYMKCYH